MKADTWMALYVGAYLADTMHLARQHHGSYLLLIMAAFKNAGWLPNDDHMLAQVAKCTAKEWKAERELYARYFEITDERWTHAKVTKEWEKAQSMTRQRSEAGTASAAKRQREANARSTTVEVPSPRISRPLQSQPPVTNNHQVERETGADAPALVDAADDALSLWNQTAERIGLPIAQRLTDPRRRALKTRLSESGGLPGWQAALAKLEASSFLTGRCKRSDGHENWRCDLDFILRQAKFTKLMEGGFDDPPDSAKARSGLSAALAGLA